MRFCFGFIAGRRRLQNLRPRRFFRSYNSAVELSPEGAVKGIASTGTDNLDVLLPLIAVVTALGTAGAGTRIELLVDRRIVAKARKYRP